MSYVFKSEEFNEYSKKIPPYMYKYKVKNYHLFNNMNLSDIYTSHIIELTEYEKNKINNAIGICEQYINNYNIKCIWNIIQISNNIEQSMPFTMTNCIILPQQFVSSLCKQITKKILITLVHEQIHIHQKNNPNIYNELYIEMGWYPLDGHLSIYNIFTNPDINNFWYLPFIRNNKEYYGLPLLVLNNGTLNLEFYIIENDGTLKISDYFEDYIIDKCNFYSNCYHPEEICAESLARYIIDKNSQIDDVFKKFLLNI